MEASKRTGIFIWSGVAAAAAGILAVAVIFQLRARKKSNTSHSSHLRDVQDVLADCYQKIREIEEHLPGVQSLSERSVRLSAAMKSNGNSA